MTTTITTTPMAATTTTTTTTTTICSFSFVIGLEPFFFLYFNLFIIYCFLKRKFFSFYFFAVVRHFVEQKLKNNAAKLEEIMVCVEEAYWCYKGMLHESKAVLLYCYVG